MDKHQIGVNAGKVWKLLNDNKRWSYCDLKRASELSDRDLNAAIGWLARENKIDFECSNGDDCLSLIHICYVSFIIQSLQIVSLQILFCGIPACLQYLRPIQYILREF